MRNKRCEYDDQNQPLLQFPDTGLRKMGKSSPSIFKHSTLCQLPKSSSCINREIILRSDPAHAECMLKISICYPQHWMNLHHPPQHPWDQGLRSIPVSSRAGMGLLLHSAAPAKPFECRSSGRLARRKTEF